MKIKRVISGGQTGADRAALDAAIDSGVDHGGWCPAGRRAEDGPIPDCYHLSETSTADYAERTRANVLAADLTIIFYHDRMFGGTLLTRELAVSHGKRVRCVDLSQADQWRRHFEVMVGQTASIILNVAGPRASDDPAIYDAVYQHIRGLLEVTR